jgi:hypothetical protein
MGRTSKAELKRRRDRRAREAKQARWFAALDASVTETFGVTCETGFNLFAMAVVSNYSTPAKPHTKRDVEKFIAGFMAAYEVEP